MLFSLDMSVWFYRKPVDFRKQMDGLILLVADQLTKNPASGELYVFRSKSADRLKLLYWERNGFWLCYRRLEAGSFRLPSMEDEAMSLSKDQLHWLLSGLNLLEHQPFSEVKVSHFY